MSGLKPVSTDGSTSPSTLGHTHAFTLTTPWYSLLDTIDIRELHSGKLPLLEDRRTPFGKSNAR